jgi:hypothetical protein
MAFPSSPSNGQSYSTGGVTYKYDSTIGVWKIQTYSTIDAGSALSQIKTVDGSGSGLDADFLDGQSSAYYLAATSYTAADVRDKLLTVDGAGSGIDADTVDGKHASELGANAGIFFENNITVTANYTITANKNAMTAGPVTIADGVTVTIPNGSTWTIV